MRREVFAFTHPRRLWPFFLPPLLAAAALAVSTSSSSHVYGAIFTCLTAALAVAEGVLLALDLPKARALDTQARQLQAVYQVISKAGNSLDLQEVLDAITRLTVEVTGVRGCSIKLLDSVGGRSGEGPRGDTMRVRSLAGIRREVSELAVDAAENIYAKSLLDGRPVEVEGAQESDFPELDGEVESLVCVPLRRQDASEASLRSRPASDAPVRGKVIGALCLYSEKGRKLPPQMLSFLSRLGDLVTISIENASVYESLKRIDEAKTWFLLKASHELKSPLASIQSICRTILDGYLGEVPSAQREPIERIRFRSSLLMETANDLLVLARAKSRSPEEPWEAVELCGLLEEAVRFYRPAAEEKGVRLDISSPCSSLSITASREEVRSVMSNLISNGIKYSPPGSAVMVSLLPADGGARFTVIDRGIGIPESEKPGLFREFFRATNARSMTEAGTGLGLAIVKSVVDRLGGSIEVQSEEGKGTSVSVTLAKGP